MSRVNDVHSGIWATDDFLALSPHGKLLYFWAFTNADNPMSGIYRVARRVMAFATGLAPSEVVAALGEIQAARFVLYADEVMFVRTRVKHLRTQSEQIAKSIARDVLALPVEHPVRRAFFTEYGEDRVWGAGNLFTQLHGESPAQPKAQESRKPKEPAVKFNGKVVPAARVEVAEQILADFNERAGTSYKPTTKAGKVTEPFRRVLGAVVEHDDIDAALGVRINEAGLSDPWWGDGPAQPGNVWGPNVVDRNRQKALGLGRTQLRPVAHTADDFMAATARRKVREDQQTGDAA